MADEIIEVRLRPDGAVILERKLDRIEEEVRPRRVKVEEHRVLTARGERADADPHYQKVEIWQRKSGQSGSIESDATQPTRGRP